MYSLPDGQLRIYLHSRIQKVRNEVIKEHIKVPCIGFDNLSVRVSVSPDPRPPTLDSASTCISCYHGGLNLILNV